MQLSATQRMALGAVAREFRSAASERRAIRWKSIDAHLRLEIEVLANALDTGAGGFTWPRVRLFDVLDTLGLTTAIWHVMLVSGRLYSAADSDRLSMATGRDGGQVSSNADIGEFVRALERGDFRSAYEAELRLRAQFPLPK